MANIYQQIEAYENALLNNIALYLKRITGLNVYVMDKPFIKPNGPYLAIRIASSDDSGGWSQLHSLENDMFSYTMDHKYDVELMAYRGRPMTLLSYVLATLRGSQELKYQYLYSKGIGFLSATNVAQANTVLDGDKTESRARMILTFNSRMTVQDIPTTPIEKINMEIHSFRESYDDLNPLVLKSGRTYVVVPPDPTKIYYFFQDDKSLINYIPKDNQSE